MFADNIRQNGVAFPSIDLFFAPQGDLRKKAAASVTVLTHVQNQQTSRPAFTHIQVVAPKGAVAVNDVMLVLNGVAVNPTVRLSELEQLTTEAVSDLLAKCPEGSAVVILNAALFVSTEVKPVSVDGNPTFSLSEDLWAPQLLHFVRMLEEVNSTAKCYIIIDSGVLYPGRKELQDSFMGVQTLAIIASDHSSRTNETLAAMLELWERLLKAGRIGPALQSIEALPEAFDEDKPYLRVRLLHEAGLTGKALDAIGALDTSRASVDATLKLAKIAVEAGGLAASRKLLEEALPRLVSLPNFEVAMDVAQLLESNVLVNQIEDRYRRRYPNQATQHRHVFRRLVEAGLYEDALEKSVGLPPETVAALEFCRTHLPLDKFPNYADAGRALSSKDNWARLAFVWMVEDALRRRLVVYAFELVFGDLRPRNMQVLGDHAFTVMRELMLSVANDAWPVSEERVSLAVGDLVAYVALRPDEPTRRFKLDNLLSHKVVGARGLARLLHQILHAAPPDLSRSQPKALRACEPKRVETAIRVLREHLDREGLVFAGRLQAPDGTLDGSNADGILQLAQLAIEDKTRGALTDAAVNETLIWLSIASMAVPHSSMPNADLELYRHVAGRMATTGHPQQARNLIDMVLLGAGTIEPVRLREAWFVCADIYSRLRQHHEGLIAVSCGLSIQCEIDLLNAVREADVTCRLMRDIGAYEIAGFFHERSGELLRLQGQFDANAAMHEYVGFTIEVGKLKKGLIAPAALLDLIHRMHRNARQVLQRGIPEAPMAVLLGQVLVIAQDEGLEISLEVTDTLNSLGAKLSGREQNLFREVATAQASAVGLLRLHLSSGPARYARDASYDASDTAVAARRLLSRKQLDDVERVLALELLCDRAAPLPGWQTVSQPVHQITAVSEPAAWAIELSRRQIDVVLIGFDERGRVHAVLARNGAILEHKVLVGDFDTTGYLKWSKHFPYLYGIDEKTPNLFAVSTEGFNFPFAPSKTTAIVATNRLQLLPPTLYRVGEEFLGQLVPVFAAPSLGWLYTASSSPPATDKRITGWISVAETNGVTLAMVRDRLDGMLVEHQVALDTGTALPDGLWGSELSFVVAHGSVLPEKRYFQHVSDEGVLKVTTEDFARAFKNVGVVVLFVCSAGRSDQAPEGESNYGLARELLGQGCSAVIASPWPIDPRVAYHWLPKFMDAWSGGKNVTDATFEANKHVEQNYNSELRHCLAMTVFGDGLRLRMT